MVDEPTNPNPAASAPSAPSSSQPASPLASPANPSASASPEPTPNSAAPATAAKAARPDYVPETFWDAEKGIKPEFGQHFRDLTAFKAAEDSRKLTLPQKPEDLKLTLPKDFKAPEGIEFVPNENDPVLPQARAFALKHGLSQEGWAELVALHAAGQIGTQQGIKTAKEAEVAKLGPTGTARKTAVDTYLVATLGEELGKEMSRFTYTAKQIEGWEKLMANARNQGNGTFTPQHRENAEPGKVSDAEYQKMRPQEKMAYAAKFPQPSQQQANGRA